MPGKLNEIKIISTTIPESMSEVLFLHIFQFIYTTEPAEYIEKGSFFLLCEHCHAMHTNAQFYFQYKILRSKICVN